MNELDERIKFLEETVANLKKKLRRIKSTVNKVEKLGLISPTELLIKKENIEVELEVFIKELKTFKKVVELIK